MQSHDGFQKQVHKGMPMNKIDLVCPAGSFPALKSAVDNGASAVYLGFKDSTNARNFDGLNFLLPDIERGIAYASARRVKVFIALNTYPTDLNMKQWQEKVDLAHQLGVDALIAADMGVMRYATEKYPNLPIHLSVQSSATHADALRFYQEAFNIRRAVLPRVLSLTQIERVQQESPVPLEIFGFGGLCIMVEGRCHLSHYVTGHSPNLYGACSPAHAVRWEKTPRGLESRLNGVLIDRYGPDENAGYPTLCKGRFVSQEKTYHTFEEPTSLNTIALLPKLHEIGIAAIKIEGRQRSPAYVAKVTQVWRQAIDTYWANPENFSVHPRWQSSLSEVSEGVQTTLGAYDRKWQ